MSPVDDVAAPLPRARCGAASALCAGRLRSAVADRVVPESAARGRIAEPRRAHASSRRATSMAQEFTEADLSPSFRSNGTSMPDSAGVSGARQRTVSPIGG